MNRVKWAEKKAYQLLEEYQINDFPIPLEDIVERLNVRLVRESLEDTVSGLLYRTSTDTIIGVNSYHSNKRQRFTVAHEIGHLVMHEGDPVHIDLQVNFRMKNSSSTDMREVEANAFAAALLMPEHLVREEIQKMNDGFDLSCDLDDTEENNKVRELSERLQVSQQSLLIRLGKLGLVY